MRFRDGGAVELYKHSIAAQAFSVNGTRDELLAGACLAVSEHSGGAELALELFVLSAEAARFDGILDSDEGTLERERLLKKVVGAKLGGFYGGFNGGWAPA